MKLITFLILLISFSAFLCGRVNSGKKKRCVVMDFETKNIFDTAAEKIGLRNLSYVNVAKNDHCYVSFHLPKLSDNFTVEQISDCTQHFDGRIRTGMYPEELPGGFSGKKCYYQHNWVLCVCTQTYCNSPQYWPLILARSLLLQNVTRHKTTIATKVRNGLGWTDNEVVIQRSGNAAHLQCFMWFADTVGQDEYNAPYYLYNYITTRHNAPPLANALTTQPRLRYSRKNKPPTVRHYIEEDEPFEDGTMSLTHSSGDGDEDEEEVPAEILEMSKVDEFPNNEPSTTIGMVVTVVAMFMYLTAIGATVHVLRKFCRKLKDHTHFIRQRDTVTLLRYERLYAADTIPKEFTKKKKSGKKKNALGSPKKNE